MGDDPYSTACIETEPVSQSKTKIIKPLNNNEFFSKAGKTRLRRIWDDNRLSEEILFTGITEPSDSSVREKVSDFVQLYLYRRARRLSLIGRKIGTSHINLVKGKGRFKEYEDFIQENNRNRDEIRVWHECERISELLINGRLKIAPKGFHEIFQDPVFKVNRLLESVKKLQRTEIKVELIPFAIKTTPIKNVDETFLRNSKPNPLCPINGTSNFSPFTDGFDESVFQEAGTLGRATSSSGIMGLKSRTSNDNTDGGGYFVEFPPSEMERDRSFSIISDMSDHKLLACGEQQFGSEDISGDLEISAEFSWQHEPLVLANDQNNCDAMYKLAEDIVKMFQRQEVAGGEFMEHFSLTYFGK